MQCMMNTYYIYLYVYIFNYIDINTHTDEQRWPWTTVSGRLQRDLSRYQQTISSTIYACLADNVIGERRTRAGVTWKTKVTQMTVPCGSPRCWVNMGELRNGDPTPL